MGPADEGLRVVDSMVGRHENATVRERNRRLPVTIAPTRNRLGLMDGTRNFGMVATPLASGAGGDFKNDP